MNNIQVQPFNTKLRLAILALILVSEIGCLSMVANMTFSSGMLSAVLTACILTGQLVILTHLALRRVSEKYKPRLLKAVLYLGCVLVLLGFFGACLILLPIATAGNSVFAMANMLLILGLILGIPLVVTSTYEDEQEKRIQSISEAVKDKCA